jgi:hypothetical protein
MGRFTSILVPELVICGCTPACVISSFGGGNTGSLNARLVADGVSVADIDGGLLLRAAGNSCTSLHITVFKDGVPREGMVLNWAIGEENRTLRP